MEHFCTHVGNSFIDIRKSNGPSIMSHLFGPTSLIVHRCITLVNEGITIGTQHYRVIRVKKTQRIRQVSEERQYA